MTDTLQSHLEDYAQSQSMKVFTSQADLSPKDKPMVEMAAWCAAHQDIVVMNSGLILSSAPTSRNVQNCKIVMLNKDLNPGKVVAASPALVAMLLANANAAQEFKHHGEPESVSEQQQRLRHLIREARQSQASDVHIEVRADIARIRFRKHGELYLHAEWMAKLGRELASVAFNKETDNAVSHFNPMIPQSASMTLRLEGQDIRLRLASMPAHGGFDIVMRVLATADDHIEALPDLGYNSAQIDLLKKAMHYPHGAVLIAGPTGSGKTTTVASCLQSMPSYRKVYSIEEPVEKVVKNVSQVPIHTEKEDRSFAAMGRAALRMDPDVIVLGEMRDEPTAHVMVRAALTGHLVYSTLHANSATGIVTRLVDMGISPVLLADKNVLVSLICQRLVPVLCSNCKRALSESEEHREHIARLTHVLKDIERLKVRGLGCDQCFGTGLIGRTVIAEIIWVDDKGREFIQQVDTVAWEHYLREQGWRSHQEAAIDLVQQGLCDPLDVEQVIGELNLISNNEVYRY